MFCTFIETVKCFLPKSIGRCRASVGRFYYNPEIRQCEGFTYGGCEGNANNFETLGECEEDCVLPQTPGK